MQWQDIIAMAQELATTPPSDPLHQIHLRGAVRFRLSRRVSRSGP